MAADNPEPTTTSIEPGYAAHFFDSGYHGSQPGQASQATEIIELTAQQNLRTSATKSTSELHAPQSEEVLFEEERRTTEGSFQSAKEEQTIPAPMPENEENLDNHDATPENLQSLAASPCGLDIQETALPQDLSVEKADNRLGPNNEDFATFGGDQIFEDARSPIDTSSPIRPIVRKSSLNFASLPAREPLTTKKSIGTRVSRTSHLEQQRMSYYPRHTGGKSMGGNRPESDQEEEDEDVESYETDSSRSKPSDTIEAKMQHNKTSTQRLQDQISMLGQLQSQPHRPSKSIPSMASLPQSVVPPAPAELKSTSLQRIEQKKSAPGAFPDEEEDSWIGPPTAAATSIFSPRAERPILTKSHTAAVMENIGLEIDDQFAMPKQRSPLRDVDVTTTPRGHVKAASTSIIRSPNKGKEVANMAHKKGVSVSNPNLASMIEQSPPKSPSRSIRDSPLKAAKDKLSSIFKTSKGLFASSAATSAEAKTAILSPLSIRQQHSMEDVSKSQVSKEMSLYPSLEGQPLSPTMSRKTRASTEREEKKKEKEAKEARIMHEQLEKLEKLREKESQKARVFSQEQERIAAMKRQVDERREQERLAKLAQSDVPKPTRTSPRKTKAQLEAESRAAAIVSRETADRDIEMSDASTMGPPPVPNPVRSAIAKASKEPAKRLTKPALQPLSRAPKPPAAPLHIRVHTGQRPMQPSNSTLAAGLSDSLAASSSISSSHVAKKNGPPGPQLAHKASISSIKSTTSTKKPAALAAAARKKEQDERDVQRRRDLKLEIQKKRAAEEEEKRQEQEQLEMEKKREQRQKIAAHKADAQRQILEKAKVERPPPPAARSQKPDHDWETQLDKPLPAPPAQREAGPARPGSRMNTMRPQEETNRAQHPASQSVSKAAPKRPLAHDNDDYSRPTLQRSGPSYTQHNEKRRRTGDEVDDTPAELPPRPNLGAPIRQSHIRPLKVNLLHAGAADTINTFHQDAQSKSIFQNGYANVPGQSHGGSNLLQQATRTAQVQSKPAHPMDMAHNSKAPITFAPHGGQALQHKTPARPLPVNGKSTGKPSAKSSPRYQNGENIDLPEIHTDSEDEDSDDGGKDFQTADWVNSPDLRARLLAQENIDPVSVFGLPGELKMEEVFKNKERWGRFRQRTSSANWSGNDRLTEDEINKDLEARARLRREGAWTYGLS